ncbi:MAG: hypothetical protein GC192_23590 [Bacteroidetes bacterium]|nr:hypothetical protein [Bacteroidota bacterium]
MIEIFLKAKHWQLFLLTFGIPMVCQIIFIGSTVVNLSAGNGADPEMMLNFFKFFPFLMSVIMAIFFGWFWAVALGLDRKIPEHLKLKLGRFKLLIMIPIIYITFFFFFIGWAMNSMGTYASEPNPAIFGMIIPLHLFSMFCIFYSLYFVAKTIKTAELQREVVFGDFAGEFFMIWFYPIGIWIVQPKINRMVEE